MAYNSDGYIMIDFTEVDFRRTNQTIEGLYKRCVDVIGTNKFILVINANGRTPLPATCSFTNNQYVIDTVIYMFAVSSNDNLFIRRNDVPASDIIDDSSISVDKTWSSNKIDSELDTKADTSALADYQPLLTPGTNITIDENNVISASGGAVIDDSVIVNNKVWSSLNTVSKLAPIDTIVTNPAVFKTSLALPLVECSTRFTPTQEGSGSPTPSNVRTIVGVDDITITANEVDTVIDLDGTYYGGIVNVLTGVMKVTHAYATTLNKTLDITSYTYAGKNGVSIGPLLPTSQTRASGITNMSIVNNDKMWIGVNNKYVYWIDILDILNISLDDFKLWIVDHPLEVAYIMRDVDQFEIQLTPEQISTIIGANSIESDTGSITVSYKYLPEDLF